MPIAYGAVSQLPAVATPAGNPPAGSFYMYFKSDGVLYKKDSAGVEAATTHGTVAGGQAALTTDASGNVSITYSLGGATPTAITALIVASAANVYKLQQNSKSATGATFKLVNSSTNAVAASGVAVTIAWIAVV